MKILILLLGITTALGTAGKKTAKDIEEIKHRQELREMQRYPNLLPEVVITISRDSLLQ